MAYIGQSPVDTFSPVPSKDSFTGDGSTTTFDLQNAVVNGGENALEVFVNNVRQEPGSGKAFTLGPDGSNAIKRITFSAAPASGAAIYVINDKTSNTSIIRPTDLNGTEFILDADADTSLTADTDDRIDIKLANTDHISFGTSSGDTVIKPMTDAKDIIFQQYDGNKVLEINDGGFVGVGGNSNAAGEIRIYEDTDDGSHYVGFKAGNNTASVSYVLPTADGTSGYQLTTDGSGTLSWAAAQITLANDGNNRIVTGTGSSSLNAEANATFDGSTLAITGAATISTNLDVDGTTNLDAVDIDGAVQIDGTVTVGANDQGYDVILYGDTASANVTWDTSADDLIFNGAAGLIVPDGQLTLGSTAITSTAAEINIIDGDTSASSVTIVDADQIILNDGGTMKQVAVSALNTYTSSSIAADDVSTGDAAVNITTSSGNITIDAAANDTDIIFKGTDATADITMLTLDGSDAGTATFNHDIILGNNSFVQFGDAGEKMLGDGTDLTINSSNDLNLTATTDINIPANVGLTFGDDAEKIEGDGTDLTIAGNNINLTAVADVNIPSGVGLTFATAEKIESDGTDLTVTVGSGGDINIGADIGVTFGDDGEKIEGDGTDLTIASSAKINLTATSDVHIPNNVGIVFGGDSEKIEGDGTDMTISANNLTIDAAADITLDADGADIKFADGGTNLLGFANSSSDVVIKPLVDAKDIIFHQYDGTSILEINDGGYALFTAAALNAEIALSDGSTISWNALTQPVAKVTLGGNRTLGAASGGVAGQFISLLVIQDGTGSRTLTWNAAYEFASDTAPTLTTTASKGDLFVFRYKYNGSKWLEVGRNLALTLS